MQNRTKGQLIIASKELLFQREEKDIAEDALVQSTKRLFMRGLSICRPQSFLSTILTYSLAGMTLYNACQENIKKTGRCQNT